MEAVGRLASGTAHDFNNLLTAIVGHASLLHDNATDPETLEDVEAILDAAGRGAELVRDLLALSRRRARRTCGSSISRSSCDASSG